MLSPPFCFVAKNAWESLAAVAKWIEFPPDILKNGMTRAHIYDFWKDVAGGLGKKSFVLNAAFRIPRLFWMAAGLLT